MKAGGGRGHGSALVDLAGSLILLRDRVAGLLGRKTSLPLLLLLLSCAMDGLVAVQGRRAPVSPLLAFPAEALFSALFWLLLVNAAAEPALFLLLRSSEDDLITLLSLESTRPALRAACLTSLAAPKMLPSLAFALSPEGNFLTLFATAPAVAWGLVLLWRFVNVGWRFAALDSLWLVLAPWLVAVTLGVLITSAELKLATALLLLPLLWPALGDTRRRLRARLAVRAFARAGSGGDLEAAVRAVRTVRDGKGARDLLLLVDLERQLEERPHLVVELLTVSGEPLEAIDVGLGCLEAAENKARVHTALAEANLMADDPENAIAHAQESEDLGGGAESLLIQSLAHFQLDQVYSGIELCLRVVAIARLDRSPLNKALARQARIMLRRYDSSEFYSA